MNNKKKSNAGSLQSIMENDQTVPQDQEIEQETEQTAQKTEEPQKSGKKKNPFTYSLYDIIKFGRGDQPNDDDKVFMYWLFVIFGNLLMAVNLSGAVEAFKEDFWLFAGISFLIYGALRIIMRRFKKRKELEFRKKAGIKKRWE